MIPAVYSTGNKVYARPTMRLTRVTVRPTCNFAENRVNFAFLLASPIQIILDDPPRRLYSNGLKLETVFTPPVVVTRKSYDERSRGLRCDRALKNRGRPLTKKKKIKSGEEVWFRETRRHLFASVAGELTPFRLGRQREKKGGRSVGRARVELRIRIRNGFTRPILDNKV